MAPRIGRVAGLSRWMLLAAGLLMPSGSAYAQGFDANAQELLRQQERERALREKQEQRPDVRLQTPAAEEPARIPAEAPCVPIHAVRLTGDSSQRFEWALEAADLHEDRATGRCLGAAGINLVMRRVQNAILEAGYVTTRVLAAPQDLKTGILVLTVIPGQVREVRFSAASDPRATGWNAMPVRSGAILNLRDLEQGLENFKRVPTAEADIQIVPAEGADAQPGESDVIITWTQRLPLRLSVSADDSGSKATGKYQGAVTLAIDHWWTLNDLFYVSFSQDLGGGHRGERGTRGYTVHYDLPFDHWLLGLTASEYDFHQSVAGANQTYIYSGTSRNAEARLARIVYRDAVRKTGAYVRGWMRTSNNFIDDTEIEVQRRRTAGWETGLFHREFVGAATVDAGIAYRRGTGAMDATTAPEESFGEGTSRLKLMTADVALTVPFVLAQQRFRYTGVLRGQWNRTPLVPQDRFSIGGRYTVRGFDGQTTLIGDRGWLVRNEVGAPLGSTGQELYLGVDYGEVGGRSARFLPGRHLAGVVLGLRGGYKGFAWDVFVGQPVSKPDRFETASTTAGFNLFWSY